MNPIAETGRFQHLLKLRPTSSQERTLERWLWHLTGVWNWAVRKIEADAMDGVRHSPYDFGRMVAGHSTRMQIPADAIAGMTAGAHDAWRRCYSRIASAPKLKGQRNKLNWIPLPHGKGIKISSSRVKVPVLGEIRFHKCEIPSGRVSQVRLIRRSSGWYACLTMVGSTRHIAHVSDESVGIDPGYASLLTLSSGAVVPKATELSQGKVRLAQAQRGHRRALTARLHERVRNRRKDRNHKLSRQLVAEHSLIAWSKDKVSSLQRSFGKSVASAGHSQLRMMLVYKCRSGGRRFVEVDSRNSTRTCSACRALTGPTGFAGLSVRQWACGQCGTVHDRDVNAAMNTLIAGAGIALERGREAAPGIATQQHGEVQQRQETGRDDVRRLERDPWSVGNSERAACSISKERP